MHPFGNFEPSCRQPFILCIPSVNTESCCKHSFNQHTTTSVHHAFRQSTLPHGGQIKPFHQLTQHHVVVRSSCIPPVGLVPHGGQIIIHSTSRPSTTWWSDYHPFHQSTQHHVAVIPPINTVPHGPSAQYHMTVRSHIPSVNIAPCGGQIKPFHQSNNPIWWSDQTIPPIKQSDMVVRSSHIPPVSAWRPDLKLVRKEATLSTHHRATLRTHHRATLSTHHRALSSMS